MVAAAVVEVELVIVVRFRALPTTAVKLVMIVVVAMVDVIVAMLLRRGGDGGSNGSSVAGVGFAGVGGDCGGHSGGASPTTASSGGTPGGPSARRYLTPWQSEASAQMDRAVSRGRATPRRRPLTRILVVDRSILPRATALTLDQEKHREAGQFLRLV